MIKRLIILTVLLCLTVVTSSPLLTRAQSGLTVTGSSVEIGFPIRLTFNISASSSASINDIRLKYSVARESFARVTGEAFVQFVPSATVSASWTLDLRRVGGLPPGSVISYWWVVKDASGQRVETAPSELRFDDTRYSWRSITEGNITMYWYEGADSFARGLMSAAQQALVKLAGDTGAQLEKPVRMYIYANSRDLQGSMIFPQEWTGGVAFTRHGTIVIGIAPDNTEWGKRAITHELTHLVVSQMTSNPYNDLPTWLEEGLAVYNEGQPSAEFSAFLNQAIRENRLISVRSLSSSFSAFGEEASLSYAESHSIVEFLIGNYGRAKMLELLNTFRQGSSYDGALEKVYGFDMNGLDSMWRQYILARVSLIRPFQNETALSALASLLTSSLTNLKLALRWTW